MHSGRLFQHFLVDAFTCCELNDLNWLRQNQQTLRADLYSGVMDRLGEGYELNDIGSKVAILPSSHIGSPRYMKARKQDAMALVRELGKPTFFLTMTCNPDWPEFERDLPPGVSAAHRADLTARIFQLKLKELLRDLTERHVLGEIKAHTYVIEFQKRGLPHAHILIIADSDDALTEPNVDAAVQAVIPVEAEDPVLYELVTKHMIHKNCKNKRDGDCKDENGNCTKFFPKPELDAPNLNHSSGYPQYRRPPFGEREKIHGVWDNFWVVPYNTYLLKKYGCHLNVEACTSVKPVGYLYKYIFKGSDCGRVYRCHS